jgi:hypothetical protein
MQSAGLTIRNEIKIILFLAVSFCRVQWQYD